MEKWIYAIGGLLALMITTVSGYFVGEHLLWVRTFGWPILTDAGLVGLGGACLCGLIGTVFAARRLATASTRKAPVSELS